MDQYLTALDTLLDRVDGDDVVISRADIYEVVGLIDGSKTRDQIAEEYEEYECQFEAVTLRSHWRVRYNAFLSEFRCERVPTAAHLERYAEINRRIVEEEVKRRLIEMDGYTFERAIAEIMRGCEWVEEVVATAATRDGGVDLKFLSSHEIIGQIVGLAQIKRWQKNVPVGAIREFIGVLETAHPRPHLGMFVALVGYTQDALDAAAQSKIPLKLFTLDDVLDWQRESQAGIKVVQADIYSLDEIFWKEVNGVTGI